jgi:hypothetical protein
VRSSGSPRPYLRKSLLTPVKLTSRDSHGCA